MKKSLLSAILLFLFSSMLIFSYQYDNASSGSSSAFDFDDVNDLSLSELAGRETVWLDLGIHSPVDTYNPAIKFQTRFILNDVLRLGLAGFFYNEATFSDTYDESSSTDTKTQDWTAIKNFLEVYLGWQTNDAIHLGFMLGGGSWIDKYSKEENNTTSRVTISSYGYGYVKTGLGVKLTEELFNDNLEYMLFEQYAEVDLMGTGSIGVEDFSFGTSNASRWSAYDSEDRPVSVLESSYFGSSTENLPNVTRDWNANEDDYFKYYGLKAEGRFKLSVPLHYHIYDASIYDHLSLYAGLYYKLAPRFYTDYDYYDETTTTVRAYNIKSHFDPSGVALTVGLLFRPIEEISLDVSYQPNFIISGTEWEDGVNLTTCKDYIFAVVHQFEVSGYFKFPRVVGLKIGTRYFMTQRIEYQYQTDGTLLQESIGGGSLTHSLKHYIQPLMQLDFKIVDKEAAQTKLIFLWDPKIIILDDDKYYDKDPAGDEEKDRLDANILNLANWEMSVDIKFDPSAL